MEITENTGEVGVDHERSICRGMHLVWEDLTVVVPNFGNGHTRRLLDGLSGYAEPGRIMAIMGPSGSGKSTLLDSLAGSLSLSLMDFFFLIKLSWIFYFHNSVTFLREWVTYTYYEQ